MEKKVYYIQSIDCANCAAKIEHKINQMPEVQEAILTFATKPLKTRTHCFPKSRRLQKPSNLA